MAPWLASDKPIAAPMPRVPPVTNATRSLSLSPDGACVCSRFSVTDMCFSPSSAVRALAEPVGEFGPDLLLRLGFRHEPDVATGAVEVRDVAARHEVEQRQRARRGRDVVGAGGHDQQVLV